MKGLLAVDPDTNAVKFFEDLVLFGEDLLLLLFNGHEAGLDTFKFTKKAIVRSPFIGGKCRHCGQKHRKGQES